MMLTTMEFSRIAATPYILSAAAVSQLEEEEIGELDQLGQSVVSYV